jgi:hypothetical protein
MTIWRLLMISAAALGTSSISSQAGPCHEEIYRMEVRLEALLQAKTERGQLRPRAPKPFSTTSRRGSR